MCAESYGTTDGIWEVEPTSWPEYPPTIVPGPVQPLPYTYPTYYPPSVNAPTNREFSVYLAGPISGLTYGGATDWRAYVASQLPPWIKALSPMRGKKYLDNGETIGDSYEDILLSSQSAITARDRFDVQNADLVLFNFLDADRVSIGSCIEVGWADAFRTPAIAVMEEGNLHDHAMIREIAGWRADTLDAAIAAVKAILTPGV